MNGYETLNHTTWDCKYHIVFIPKRRRKVLYQELRRHLGEVFRQLAAQKESKIEEGHLLPDHVHMLLSHSTEVCGVASGRIHQRQERDPSGPHVRRAKAEFRRAALLGSRIFREHGWAR